MYNTYQRNTRSQKTIPWMWIGVVFGIILLLFIAKFFSGSDDNDTGAFLTITPGEQSSVYISMSNVSKARIGIEEKLYATDKSVSVETGYAK